MQWIYGTYSHPENEVLVRAFSARRIYNPRGRLDRIISTAVIEGEILATTQAAIEARRDQMEIAYSSEQASAVLYGDSGLVTYQMFNPRVLDIVFQQEEHKAHFATALPFTIVLEAEVFDPFGGIISFSETITKIGNSKERAVWPELDNGPAIRQIVSSHTNVTVIQSGEVVSTGGWAAANAPISTWSINLDNPTETTSDTVNNSDIRPVYIRRWNYVYTFNANVTPLPPIPR